jgi:hypothetical protein
MGVARPKGLAGRLNAAFPSAGEALGEAMVLPAARAMAGCPTV